MWNCSLHLSLYRNDVKLRFSAKSDSTAQIVLSFDVDVHAPLMCWVWLLLSAEWSVSRLSESMTMCSCVVEPWRWSWALVGWYSGRCETGQSGHSESAEEWVNAPDTRITSKVSYRFFFFIITEGNYKIAPPPPPPQKKPFSQTSGKKPPKYTFKG